MLTSASSSSLMYSRMMMVIRSITNSVQYIAGQRKEKLSGVEWRQGAGRRASCVAQPRPRRFPFLFPHPTLFQWPLSTNGHLGAQGEEQPHLSKRLCRPKKGRQ